MWLCISKSKRGEPTMEPEIVRKRHERCVVCYIGNKLSYNILSVFSSEVANSWNLITYLRKTNDPSNILEC